MGFYHALMYVVVGSGLLAWSAGRFVLGAQVIARNTGIPSIVIGVMLIGFATSLPEMIVAAMSAWRGNPMIGVGSAVGSNIANIGLVLGLSALVLPLRVESAILKREFPMLFATLLFTGLVFSNGHLHRLEGGLLLLGFLALLVWLSLSVFRNSDVKDPMIREIESEIPAHSTVWGILWSVIGFVVLIGSSRLLIVGAIQIGKLFEISDLVIGLTVVAIGTSLPELATSIISVWRGEPDLAIGNILGSCMFNLLAVVGVSALIHPTLLPRTLLLRDFPLMSGFAVVLLLMAYGFRGKAGRINRWEGLLLLVGFLGYLVLLGGGYPFL